MFRYWRPTVATFARVRVGVGAAAIVLGAAGAAQSVTVTGDPEFGYNGVDDVTPAVFTVDPYDEELVTGTGNRGVTGNRMLRQTFKMPTAINVGEIVIGFDVTGGAEEGTVNDTGLGLRIYEVEDVNANSWAPVGDPIAEILYTDTLPGSDESLSFALNQGEVFELPASPAGTAGYGIEISTPFALSTDGNPGGFTHTNVDGTDFYADGAFYLTDGGQSGGESDTRDIGISIIPTATAPCLAGDANCDNVVDVETDLAAIADHFRQEVELRADGDLTGNGFVDFSDFDEWKTNFSGSTAGLDFGFLAAVPEPAGATLLALGAAPLVGARRRSKGGAA